MKWDSLAIAALALATIASHAEVSTYYFSQAISGNLNYTFSHQPYIGGGSGTVSLAAESYNCTIQIDSANHSFRFSQSVGLSQTNGGFTSPEWRSSHVGDNAQHGTLTIGLSANSTLSSDSGWLSGLYNSTSMSYEFVPAISHSALPSPIANWAVVLTNDIGGAVGSYSGSIEPISTFQIPFTSITISPDGSEAILSGGKSLAPFNGTGAGGTYYVSDGLMYVGMGSDIILPDSITADIVPVPEPTVCSLICLSALSAFAFHRRKRT